MGIRFKLFIPTLFLLATASLVIHFFWLPYYLASEVEQHFKYERDYLKLLSNTMVSDLLANDLEKINSTLDRVVASNERWRAVRLYKDDQHRIYPLFEKPLPEGVKLELLQHPIQFNDENIAHIMVWIDLGISSNKNIKFVRYLEQLLLSLLLGVSLIAIIFQDRWIRNPLKQLATYASEIADGNYETELYYQSKDEIGKLADSFNSMRKQIGQREKDLKYYSSSLEKLHGITTHSDFTFDQKINALLKLGREIFALPLGIVSHVIGERYIIDHVISPDGKLEPGAEFILGETYCSNTLSANGPVGFHHASESTMKNHPCYKELGLEAYIGAPLYIGDKLFGTLNFSSHDIRNKPFTFVDYSIIQLFAQWIGTEMARANAEAELERLSQTDGLTGVANRRYLDEALSQELNRAIRNHTSITLIFCDVDYFKNYNDSYGHQAGDSCLQQVTRVIQSTFSRAGELVARYGGEEFVIIIPAIKAEQAIKLAEDMRINVTSLKLKHESSDVSDYVTISVGLTTITPDQTTTMGTIIGQADSALYRAKKKGRNNVQVFS